MEEQPTPATNPPNPAPAAPIMDVKAPPAVVAEPGVAPTAAAPAPTTPPTKQPDQPAATPTNTPPKKPTAKGVTTAIIATVVIVLGLAVLAVAAYIKTK